MNPEELLEQVQDRDSFVRFVQCLADERDAAIAEENNIRMPGFFGYMLYSCGILVPILVIVTVLFFL